MFGLGIYLADQAQKSHRYVSQGEPALHGRRRLRMLVCSVLGQSLELAGHLRSGESMHDVTSIRELGDADHLGAMLEPVCGEVGAADMPDALAIETGDLLFVKGLGPVSR